MLVVKDGYRSPLCTNYHYVYTTTHFGAQSFIASASYDAVAVGMKMRRGGTSGAATIELQADNGNKPNGTALATASIPQASIPLGEDGTEIYLIASLDTAVSLVSGTKYWLVLKALSSANITNGLRYYITTPEPYDGGVEATTSNGGTNWTLYAQYDADFGVYAQASDVPAIINQSWGF